MPQINVPFDLIAITRLNVPGASHTTATSINDHGQIVGHFTDATGEHGFLNQAGSFSQPIDYPGAVATYILGINNYGQIVGQFQDLHGTYGFFYNTGIFSTRLVYPGAPATFEIKSNVGYAAFWK